MKSIFRLLPLSCLALAASSCSSAILSLGRDPDDLRGKSRTEVLQEFGQPLKSSTMRGFSDDRESLTETFRVGGSWQASDESIGGNEFMIMYTLGLAEPILIPTCAVLKTREAIKGRELSVRYKKDRLQTVEEAWLDSFM